MSLFAVAQLLVALAICLNILALQCRQRRTIILLLLVSCSLVAVHFLLLGYTTAAGLLLLSMARLAFMCAACLWIVHNGIVGSPVAMANDALFLVSNLIGYYRFHIRPKRHLLS